MPRPFGVSTPAPVRLTVLRAKRMERGLTLQQLSNLSGVPLNAICKIERGSRAPTEHELGALAWALDVAPPSALLREVALTVVDSADAPTEQPA